jgi:ATP/maltotriose-dependent transcriptional regulator MalT
MLSLDDLDGLRKDATSVREGNLLQSALQRMTPDAGYRLKNTRQDRSTKPTETTFHRFLDDLRVICVRPKRQGKML